MGVGDSVDGDEEDRETPEASQWREGTRVSW